MTATNWTHRCFFIVTLLLCAAFVSADSATQDGFSISAPDVVCTVSRCSLPSTVCNVQGTPAAFAPSFVAEQVEPQRARVLVTENYAALEPVYQTSVQFNNTSGRNETIQTLTGYDNASRTRLVWEDQEASAVDAGVSRGLTLASDTFDAGECRQYQFVINNVIGGNWKYGVNFLDPFINSSQYQIGNTSNSSNTWDIDENDTVSTVRLTETNLSFTVGVTGTSAQLIAYYPLDGNTSDTYGGHTANSSGITAAASGSCKIGTCYDWDANGDYVKISAAVVGGRSEGSINFWAVEDTASAQRNLFGYGATNYLRSQLQSTGNTYPYFQIAGETNLNSGTQIRTGDWVMYTYTWNSTTRKIFLNGTEVASDTNTGTTETGGVFCLGNNPVCSHASEWWDGRFDEVSFYSDVLSAQDISYLYNGGAGRGYNGTAYNTSANLYRSKPISASTNLSDLTPTWSVTLNGGSVSVNVTCNADDASPSWTGNLTNNTPVQCPVIGDSLQYEIYLFGTSSSSPVMQNFTLNFDAYADESLGRQAILAGVQSSAISGLYTAYTDQQVYERLSNGTQSLATFDVFVTAGNKRYAFNYNRNNTSLHPTYYNITPVLYVWQDYNLSTAQVQYAVQQLIDNTYTS